MVLTGKNERNEDTMSAMDPTTKQRLIDEYEELLHEQGAGYYTALEMVETRQECAEADLAAGYDCVCLKVPSGSETHMPAALARELLQDIKNNSRRRNRYVW
jgi:hypothetical protein